MKTQNAKDRRQKHGRAGSDGLVIVAGLDPVERRWLDRSEAASCSTVVEVPAIEGVLFLDSPARVADAVDKGDVAQQIQFAVLRPGSVEDIQKMVLYCLRYDVKVSSRAQAHATFGQSLARGLVIENEALKTIHSIGPDGAEVDAGVKWKDLVTEAYNSHKLTPPVIPDHTGLPIGSTLSAGAAAGRNNRGPEIEHIRELEIVTGTGELLRCSMDRHRDLFEVALGGFGPSSSIITRIKMDLVPAMSMVRLYSPRYVDNATFFRDLSLLTKRDEVSECYTLWFPGPGSTGTVYELQAVVYYDPSASPDNAHLMRGLSMPSFTVAFRDLTYLEWILDIDVLLESLRATVGVGKPEQTMVRRLVSGKKFRRRKGTADGNERRLD